MTIRSIQKRVSRPQITQVFADSFFPAGFPDLRSLTSDLRSSSTLAFLLSTFPLQRSPDEGNSETDDYTPPGSGRKYPPILAFGSRTQKCTCVFAIIFAPG